MIFPSQYDKTPVFDLLLAAEQGTIGMDQRLLRSITSRPDEALDALAQFSQFVRPDAVVDLEEPIFDLFRYFKSPKALPFYVQLFRRDPANVPDTLVETLVELGQAAVEPLLKLESELEEDDRSDLIFLLAGLGIPDPRIRALIEETLDEDAYEGALCAGLSHDPALKPAVEAALAKCTPDQASERQALQDALREIDQPTQRPESEFDLFSVYPEESLPIFEAIDVEDLAAYLTSTEEGWRIGAAESLIDEEYPDSIRDLLLERVETDENVMVRAASLRALSGRNKESKIRDLLIKMISDTSLPEVLRGAGLIGLASRSTLPEFQKAVVELYEANGVARMFALEAMWQSSDLRFRKYFAPNLRHEDVDVRRQAIQGVGAYPIEELASELVPLFSDEEVRDDALFAYAMAVPAKVNPKTAEKLYREITEKVDELSAEEAELIGYALDRRLELNGFEPLFITDDDDDDDDDVFGGGEHDHDHDHGEHGHTHVVNGTNGISVAPAAGAAKVGRNDPCPCGSGKKYKKCCGQ